MSILTSRYFSIEDPTIDKFTWSNFSLDFYKMGWWSRIYEYRWIQDVCKNRFLDLNKKRVIDIATGDRHPGMFILKSVGFGEVTGTDVFLQNQLRYSEFIKDGIQYIQDDICSSKINKQFDCVVCLSLFEHLSLNQQKNALKNLMKLAGSNGYILITFDVPGYEFLTNISFYEEMLKNNGFYFMKQSIEEDKKIKTNISPLACDFLKKKALSCYRVLASREKFSVEQ